ncbi:MAG: site-2 protease family protein [Pseudomonadota bacterium]
MASTPSKGEPAPPEAAAPEAAAPAAPAVPLPQLRQDLQLLRGAPTPDGAPTWLIYDPVRHRYFSLSGPSAAIVLAWDAVPAETLLTRLNAPGHGPVTLDDVTAVLEFLYASSLTDEPAGGDFQAYVKQEAAADKTWLARVIHGYLFFRVPLVRPDGFLRATLPLVAPLWSRAALIAYALITALGLYLVSRQFDAFAATFLHFFSLQGAAAYAASLVLIKALHELGHAYAAARHRVRVNTMGIAFMVLMPMLYTDVSDAWRLRRRRERLTIDGAGIMVELVIAGLATCAWAFLPDGPLRSIAFVLATSSWALSLLVNLNPFMRFDGYHLLADSWGIANLQNRSFAFGRWWLRETLFGLGAPPPEPTSAARRRWLVAYAFGVWIYRFFLFLGIALLVYYMFFKVLGVILFVIEIAWFIALPIWREIKEWWAMRALIVKRSRSLVTAGVAATLVALAVIPWQGRIVAPAIFIAAQEQKLHAPRPARVTEVAVRNGQRVRSGALLAVLEAPALRHEQERNAVQIALLKARLARLAADDKERDQALIITRELQAAQARARGLAREAEQLELRAAFDGVVRDMLPDLHAGRWLDRKTRLLRVVAPQQAHLRGYVAEDDLWKVEANAVGRFIPDDPLAAARDIRLIDVAYAGAKALEEPYLASNYGGPIAVTPDADGVLKPNGAVYRARFAVEGQAPGRVDRGVVLLRGKPESFAARAWRQVMRVLVRESGI